MLNRFYYDLLASPAERAAYNAVRSALRRGEARCAVQLSDDAAANRVWRAAVFENPDILGYPGLVVAAQCGGGRAIYSFEYTPVDAALFEQKMQRLKDRINAMLPPSPTEYAICKAIYDVLACSVKYEHDVLSRFYNLRSRNESDLAAFLLENATFFTPYSAVVNARSVCQGISKLFKLLCESFGIECAVAEASTSDVPDGGMPNHMLNVVEVDGSRSFVDVTSGLTESIPIIKYNYFLASSRVLGLDFRVSGEFGCTDESLSYYARNGLIFRSEEKLRRFLASYARIPGRRRLRFRYIGDLSDDDLQTLISEVMDAHCSEGYTFLLPRPRFGFCCGIFADRYDQEKFLRG